MMTEKHKRYRATLELDQHDSMLDKEDMMTPTLRHHRTEQLKLTRTLDRRMPSS